MSAQIRRVTNSVGQMQRSINDVNGAMRRLSATATSTTARISRDFRRAYEDARPDNLFDAVNSAGKKLTAVGVAATAGLGYVVKTAADFESAMSRVGALSGATREELKVLTQTADMLGKTTAFSAKEAADGMSFLAMAGYKTNDIISAMPGLLNMAAAGQTDLATTADIASNILTAFGIAAEDTGKVADVLTKAFTSSNTDLHMLGQTMKYVGPIAKAAGVSLEETAAAAGILGDAGIQADMAGTALRSMLQRLASEPAAVKKALRQYGIEITDAKGNMLGLADILERVGEATEGAGQKNKIAVAKYLAGAEAMSGFLTLLDAGPDKLRNFTKELENSGGAAAEIAKKQLENLNGSIMFLKSALAGAAIAVGGQLTPHIRKISDALTSLVERFNALPEPTKRTIAVITAVATAFALIGGPLLILIALLPSIAAGFAMIGTVALPVGIATVAVGALVAAGLYLRRNWGNIKKRADELKTKLIDLKTKSIDKVKDGITAVKDKFKEWQPVIENTAKILAVVFGPALIKTGIEAVTAGGRIALNFIGSLARAGTAAVINAAKITANFISSLIRTGVQASATALVITGSFIVSLVRTGVQAAATALIITGQLVTAMLRYALSGWRVVASIAAVSLAWVAQKAVLIASTLLTWGMVAAQWALNVAMWAAPYMWIVAAILAVVAVGVLLYKNWDTIKAKAGELWASLTERFNGIKDGVISAITGTKDGFLSALNDMKSGAVSIVNGIINAFNGMVSSLNGLSFTVPDWAPGKMAGKKFGLNLNPIPNIDGSHYHGIDYVPHNGYVAELHRGERVQTAQEAKEARQTGGGGVTYQFGDIHLHGVGGDLEKAADQLMGIIVRRAYEAKEAGA